MSHTTELTDIVFTDVDALKIAVKELQRQGVKCSLKQNSTPRAYYANQAGLGQADYVLQLEDSRYDVGFYMDAKRKALVARTDLFANDVARVLGAQATGKETQQQAALGKLYHAYAVAATTRQAAKQGYSVRKVVKADGTVQLVMTVQ
jgi:hypothetical protein